MKNINSRQKRGLGLFLLILFLLSLFFLKDRSVITIGYFGPFSGGEIHQGTEIQKGLQLAVDDWNKNSGFFSAKLKLMSMDTQGMNSEVEKNIDELVKKDKAILLVGESQDQRSKIAIDYVEKNKIPLIVPFQQGLELSKDNTTTRLASVAVSEYGNVLASFLTAELKLDRAFVLKRESFEIGQEIAKSFQKEFLNKGGKSYEESVYKMEDLQHESYYQKILEKNHPIIIVMATPQETASFAKILRKNKYNGLIVGLSLWGNVDVRALAGDSIYGTFFVGSFSPFVKKDTIKNFVDKYEKIHRAAPSAYAAAGYDTGIFIQQLLSNFHFKYSSKSMLKDLMDLKEIKKPAANTVSHASVFRTDKDEDSIVFPK